MAAKRKSVRTKAKKASLKKSAKKAAKQSARPTRGKAGAGPQYPTPALVRRMLDIPESRSTPLGKLADQLHEVRATRIVLNGMVEILKAKQTALELVAVSLLKKAESGRVSGVVATVGMTPQTVILAEDWKAVRRHINKTGDWDLMERRISQTHGRELLEQGKLPKGLSFFTRNRISITKI